MKTVQMTLDESLVEEVDRAAEARRQELELELERRHRAGYTAKPVAPGEFDLWDGEQVWRPEPPPALSRGNPSPKKGAPKEGAHSLSISI